MRFMVSCFVVMQTTLWSCTPDEPEYVPPSAPEFTEIFVEPEAIRLPVGSEYRITAHGLNPYRGLVDIADTVTWEVDDLAVADLAEAVDGQPVLIGAGPGTTTLRARLDDQASAEVRVEVANGGVVGLFILPSYSRSPYGLPVPYRAKAMYSDGRAFEATGLVTWASSDELIGTIDARGMFTGQGVGLVEIEATLGEIAATPRMVEVHWDAPNLLVQGVRAIPDGVQVLVQNPWAVATSGFWVDVYRDTSVSEASASSGDGFARVDRLDALETAWVDVSLREPPSRVVAMVDINGEVLESDENDNRFEGAVDTSSIVRPIIYDIEYIHDEKFTYLMVRMRNDGGLSIPLTLRIYSGYGERPAQVTHELPVEDLGPFGDKWVEVKFMHDCPNCGMWVELVGDGQVYDDIGPI